MKSRDMALNRTHCRRRQCLDYAGTLHRGLQGEVADEIEYVEEAGAENPFVIYGRAGHPCPRCTTRLEKIDLGGRTSVFCPRCQPG